MRSEESQTLHTVWFRNSLGENIEFFKLNFYLVLIEAI